MSIFIVKHKITIIIIIVLKYFIICAFLSKYVLWQFNIKVYYRYTIYIGNRQ